MPADASVPGRGTEPPLRVLTSFRSPRATTNPYVVQLFHQLQSQPTLQVTTFSWRNALLRRWDVWHVHWPDTTYASDSRWRRALKMTLFGVLLLKIRLCRTAIVWTRHNEKPHEPPGRCERMLLRLLESATVRNIVLNRHTELASSAPRHLIPHGHYVDWFRPYLRSRAVPGRIGYFGVVRPYKGLEELLQAFASIPDPNLALVVAGRPVNRGTAERISQLAARDPRVTVALEFLPDEELVHFASECELLAFPYRSMHNSGAVLAALSIGRPVLVPHNEVTADLSREVGPGWVTTFEGEITGQALKDGLLAARLRIGAREPDLTARDWTRAGEAHEVVYRLAVSDRRTLRQRTNS